MPAVAEHGVSLTQAAAQVTEGQCEGEPIAVTPLVIGINRWVLETAD